MARANMLNSKAGYTCAVVPQSRSDEMLAKREESIYGFALETVKVLFHQLHDIMYSIDKYNELYINMISRRYKTVSNWQQISLLPPSIEDYVHETNPVRAIDAYVNTGFIKTGLSKHLRRRLCRTTGLSA
jgi:hypothetical protein